jgi:hypothetical protein
LKKTTVLKKKSSKYLQFSLSLRDCVYVNYKLIKPIQIFMQKRTFISEKCYQAPTLDLYSAPVESGFAQSLDGTGGIKDWENDGDDLEF